MSDFPARLVCAWYSFYLSLNEKISYKLAEKTCKESKIDFALCMVGINKTGGCGYAGNEKTN